MKKDEHGYEIINGTGKAKGRLLGGCIDVFMMAIGTQIWPTLEEWRNAILFVETSEDKPSSIMLNGYSETLQRKAY